MEKVLNKKALVEVLSDKTGMTKKAATETVDLILETFTKELKKGHKIDLPGFGKFEVKKRSARKGINPSTKEVIKIPATKVPAFKASKTLKEAVK